MATLSSADKANLSQEQQKQVAELKKQWAAANAAGDQAAMEAAHQAAEAIRNSAGYSGGSSGNSYQKVGANVSGSSGSGYQKNAANAGGQTADEVRKWVADYDAAFMDPQKGWVNGYDADMNNRSKANYIRQQMLANSQAWHSADEATRDYLHQQNVELAKILADATGQSEKNYSYDSQTGKWYTWNANLGYGEDLMWTMPNVVSENKKYLGVTDEEIAQWKNDTGRYFNYVDQRAIRNKDTDESSGFTGRYSHFLNGPNAQLLALGSKQTPVGSYAGIKDTGINNGYGLHLMPYVENGVIQSNVLGSVRRGGLSQAPVGGSGGSGNGSWFSGGAGSASAGGKYDAYIQQIYDALLQTQLQQLEAAYWENMATLDTEAVQTDSTYEDKKRQTGAAAAQQAAIWRETANAYGLNSGAVGQAVLAQGNQLQGDLNTLRAAQAAAQTELQRQRTQLAVEYRSAIERALAENNFEKATALYEEAVRAEEALQEQKQFDANLALQYAKLLMSGLRKS